MENFIQQKKRLALQAQIDYRWATITLIYIHYIVKLLLENDVTKVIIVAFTSS